MAQRVDMLALGSCELRPWNPRSKFEVAVQVCNPEESCGETGGSKRETRLEAWGLVSLQYTVPAEPRKGMLP